VGFPVWIRLIVGCFSVAAWIILLLVEMKTMLSHFFPACALGVLICFVACSEAPDTERTRVNLINPGKEAKLGITEFDKIKQQVPISSDPLFNTMVQVVGARLAKVIPVPDAEWEFVVFDDPTPNAFALPGGKVGINTGLFPILENEAGLAAVIGHEVGHIVARHSGERASRGFLTAGAVAAGTYLLNKNTEIDPKIATALLGGMGARSYKAHSREQELEADKLGMLYMARAGYDPEESVRFWERFANYRDNTVQSREVTLLSTHPIDSVRIDELNKYLSTAKKDYRPL